MDNNFQTSFIPKKPLTTERSAPIRHVSVTTLIATVIFFASLASLGGVYVYKSVLTKTIASQSADLARAKSAFEPSLINVLQNLDRRINSSEEILNKHIMVSPIFSALSALTLKSIRFTKFSYSISDNPTKISVIMSGTASSYKAIALQADALTQNKYLLDPLFSNLSLDEKGNVSFDLNFSVDPALVSYGESLNRLTTTP